MIPISFLEYFRSGIPPPKKGKEGHQLLGDLGTLGLSAPSRGLMGAMPEPVAKMLTSGDSPREDGPQILRCPLDVHGKKNRHPFWGTPFGKKKKRKKGHHWATRKYSQRIAATWRPLWCKAFPGPMFGILRGITHILGEE